MHYFVRTEEVYMFSLSTEYALFWRLVALTSHIGAIQTSIESGSSEQVMEQLLTLMNRNFVKVASAWDQCAHRRLEEEERCAVADFVTLLYNWERTAGLHSHKVPDHHEILRTPHDPSEL